MHIAIIAALEKYMPLLFLENIRYPPNAPVYTQRSEMKSIILVATTAVVPLVKGIPNNFFQKNVFDKCPDCSGI